MSSPNHYWLWQFKTDLRAVQPGFVVAIDIAEQRVREAKADLRRTVDACWQETKDQIKPRLRPCHQRRFDELSVEITQ